MKKISTASFIVGVVLVVASIAMIVMGALSVNSPSVYSRTVNGYTYTKMSYSISVTGIINGFMLILIGGISFIGGMLSFLLAAVTRSPKCCKKPATTNSYSQQASANSYSQQPSANSYNQQASANTTSPQPDTCESINQ